VHGKRSRSSFGHYGRFEAGNGGGGDCVLCISNEAYCGKVDVMTAKVLMTQLLRSDGGPRRLSTTKCGAIERKTAQFTPNLPSHPAAPPQRILATMAQV